ncbi:MAG: hypothetical protein OXH68_03575 [Gammaproteobacteria bacterium]|nr:hypothetical protein [Gammaproteobacteria bacterium]
MAIHAFGAVAIAEMRTAVRLVRTQFFVAAAIVAGLGIYAAQAVFHRILWASAHLVTPPRFLIDTIGTVVLAILAAGTVALAFDHRVRDRNERIAEALDTRPHSNLALVAGRLVGIVGVVWLTAVFLALVLQCWGVVASVFQWPIGDGMEPMSLVMFLFLDALPTLVFWCALTLMLAAALRFRLAVLVVTVSLIGTHLWVATNVPVFLHDAFVANLAGTHLPSDAAPVLPNGADLLQRAALLALAVGLLIVAAQLHPRLDGRATTPRVLGGIGFLAIGVLLIAELVIQNFAGQEQKAAWVAAHESHRDAPRVDLETVSGVVRIEPGRRLTIDVELDLANSRDQAMHHLVFSLNPGLAVEMISVDGVSANFRHDMGVLTIEPPVPLAAGGTIGIGIRANGVPDPRFAYLDSAIDNATAPVREARINTLGTVGSIFQHDYVALMPGVRWLPSPGSILGDGNPDHRPRDFFSLDIDVEVPEGWLVAGPGRREAVTARRFRFHPQAVVDEVGLFASRFERRAMLVNGIEFELLVRPRHLDNVRLFADAGDALKTRVKSFLDWAEQLGLGYPYRGLSLVEVPGRLRTFGGGWRMDSLEVLPGVALLREVGFPVARLDAPLHSGETRGYTDEPKVNVLERFFRGDTGGGDLRLNLARELLFAQTGAEGEGATALEFVCQDVVARLVTGAGGYFTPHLVTTGGFADVPKLLAILSRNGSSMAIGYTLRKNARDSASTWRWARRTSLADLNANEDAEMAFHALALKGQAIGRALIEEMDRGKGELISALRTRFAGRTFSAADFNAVAASVGTPVGPLLGDWIQERSLPGFVASPLSIIRLTDTREGAPRYQTRVHVHNGEPVGGLLRVRYMVRDGTTSTGIRNHWSRPIRVEAHASVEVGMVVPGPPQAGWVEPYLSLNQGYLALPPPSFDAQTQSPAEAFDGTRASDWRPFPDGEIVVDDLDPGFAVATDHSAPATAVEQDEGLPEYTMFADLPQDWTRLPVASAWGRYRHTVAVTRTKGRPSKAVFAAELPSGGRWRVDYHLPLQGEHRAATQRNNEAVSGREMAVRSGAPRFLTRPRGLYPIKVITTDQGIPVAFDASNGVEGWNPISAIELAAPGEVHVVVSLAEINSLSTPVVIADAVRWVKLPDP